MVLSNLPEDMLTVVWCPDYNILVVTDKNIVFISLFEVIRHFFEFVIAPPRSLFAMRREIAFFLLCEVPDPSHRLVEGTLLHPVLSPASAARWNAEAGLGSEACSHPYPIRTVRPVSDDSIAASMISSTWTAASIGAGPGSPVRDARRNSRINSSPLTPP